jgi:hypothetical protein
MGSMNRGRLRSRDPDRRLPERGHRFAARSRNSPPRLKNRRVEGACAPAPLPVYAYAYAFALGRSLTSACQRSTFFCSGVGRSLMTRPKSMPTSAVMSAIE